MNTELNKNRLTLLMIAGIPVIIILASSWLWYYVASGRLDIVGALGTANQGALLDPPLAFGELGAVDAAGQNAQLAGERPLWRILLPAADGCDEACRELLHYTRQIHTAMGKYRGRIERVMLASSPIDPALVAEYPALNLLYTSPSGLDALAGAPLVADAAAAETPAVPAYYLVDPAGWIILAYGADADGKDIMADLKFLLKNSN